jgi:signal transduction histidine kinase/CheY-like chemotaxis protein
MIIPPKAWKPLALLYWGLFVTIALATAMVIAIAWLDVRSDAEEARVHHTLNVRTHITEILMLVQRTETSQRGYLLTGRDSYLAPYKAAVARLPVALDELAKLISDNPEQANNLKQLRPLIAEKMTEQSQTVEHRQAGDTNAALAIVGTDKGLQLMDAIRDRLDAMDHVEDQRLAAREAMAGTLEILLRAGIAVAFVLICCVGGLVVYSTRRWFNEITSGHSLLVAKNRELAAEINRREQTESQLRQAQKMEAIGYLSGGIAHDFNNVLSAIMASYNLIRRRIAKGDYAVERFLDAGTEAAERAAALIHNLLAFARKQPLAPAPTDANELVRGISDLLRSTLGEHIEIESVCDQNLWKANVDAHQLESAILNIAINARDAMPDGGKLTIETANCYLDRAYAKQNADVAPGSYVLVALTDTGTGMTADVLAQAFDPFFTTKSPGRGSGLGLSQVYGFIKQSHGHVKIYSEPGAGTTVKIYLSRFSGATVDDTHETTLAPEAAPAGEAILVVEDDALVRRMSTDALRDLGYVVFECESAAQALAALDENPDIQLLFTDVVMPNMNGRKLVDEALRRRPGLKTLFTTGYTSNAVVHGGRLDPGVNFIGKPFSIEQLAVKIRSVLDQEIADPAT